MKRKFLYLMLLLFIGGPVLQSCGSTRNRCGTSKNKKAWAKNNYWVSKKKHKRSKWGR